MTEDEITLVLAMWNAVGLWSIPVTLVIVGVRTLRHPSVQEALPTRLQWKSSPRWAQWSFVGAASLATSLATGIVSGLGWGAALWAAVPVAVAAVWGHKATKAIGHTMHASEIATDPLYEPSPFRRAASIVVPLNRKLLDVEVRR